MLQQRIDKLRQTLKEKNIDALLISNFYNILYLSYFKTLVDDEREAWMLVTDRNCYLFSDSRYITENPKSEILNPKQIQNLKYKVIKPEKRLIQYLEKIFEEEEVKTCGIEADDLKVSEHQQLIKFFKETKFFLTEKLIIKQRELKDETEIEKIKKACAISDQCLKDTLRLIKAGKGEKEIAFKIEFWLKEKGYGLAFYPIVAVDENSALAHYDSLSGNNKKIREGSTILIDFGVKYKDYLSDMTRMVFVGKQSDTKIDVYDKLSKAQKTAIFNLRSGKTAKEIDKECRLELERSGLPIYQHSTGHGIGLQIHEYPKISPISLDSLKQSQVLTIEPGVYLTGKWGMRIEDTVLLGKNGGEALTKFNKEIIIL